jgi:hypothetical protein
MNVGELIELLKQQDPQKMVVRAGYEGGLAEVEEISNLRISLNVHTSWYYGKHEEDADGECQAISIY